MKEASTMTMRIHRAVRTLSLLLALSMLLSVSAISSAAETPAPSVLTCFGFYARFG